MWGHHPLAVLHFSGPAGAPVLFQHGANHAWHSPGVRSENTGFLQPLTDPQFSTSSGDLHWLFRGGGGHRLMRSGKTKQDLWLPLHSTVTAAPKNCPSPQTKVGLEIQATLNQFFFPT